ncbi:hypothetical protein HZU77_004495 [Neisseriaceae bacterium TC5R-5]|nr:hypothetical protein [Neisseriaceae bacterium TC5R-5]
MFNMPQPRARQRDEGEKPFWISYADLMTALMILFLVVMVGSLLMVTKRIAEETGAEKARAADIEVLCHRLALQASKVNLAIKVDCQENRIHFGEAGRFGHNDYRLPAGGSKALLDVVPLVLEAADSPEGKKWFKQVVIEGFTDTDGAYLYNLHLSLQRSEWVMCSLLDPQRSKGSGLSVEQRKQIRELFLAGGVSFNNAKESKEASRRVELRLQFFGLKDQSATNRPALPQFHLSSPETCQL